jgi:hypothetical protein
VAQSKPKNEVRRPELERVSLHISVDGSGWMVEAGMWSTFAEPPSSVQYAHGSEFGSLLAFLNTLPPTYSVTVGPRTC